MNRKYLHLPAIAALLLLFITGWQCPGFASVNATAVSLPAEACASIGGTLQLRASLTPDDATSALRWYTGNAAVATVDSNGLVTGVKAGATDITVSANGNLAKCRVHVMHAPDSVVICGTPKLTIGTSATFTTGLPEYAVTWRTGNSTILSVNDAGVAKCLKVGKTWLYARSYNGLEGKLLVEVAARPEAIALPSEISLYVGQSPTTLRVSATPSGANDYVKWRTGNLNIATVTTKTGGANNAAVLYPTALGNTRVYAESDFGFTASCMVRVKAAPESLELSSQLMISLGDSRKPGIQLTPGNALDKLSWRVGNGSIASVSEDGTITALARGSTYVYGKTANGIEARCLVRVVDALESFSLPTEVQTCPGQPIQIDAITAPSGLAGTLSWSVGNRNVAVVDEAGRVTGISLGNTSVYATAPNGQRQSCMVRVKTAPESLQLSSQMLICEGDSRKLSVQITPANAMDRLFWRAGKPSVATVSESGVVTAVSQGSTYVYGRTVNGIEARCLVRVASALESFSLPRDVHVPCGQSVSIDATTVPSGLGGTLTWRVGNPGIATVDETGRVTGIRVGNTSVYATGSNGQVQSAVVRVVDPVSFVSLPAEMFVVVGQSQVPDVETIPANLAGALNWRVGNGAIAKVGPNGMITGVRAGNTYVYAGAPNIPEQKCLIRVVDGVSSVTLPSGIDIAVGDTRTLVPELSPPGIYAPVGWSADNTDIATVDDGGAVTAKAVGETYVYATAANGKSARCLINVCPAATGISLGSDVKVAPGMTAAVVPTLTPSNAAARLTWRVGNKSIATVDEFGVVTGITEGNTTLTVTTDNGLWDQCYIRVFSKSGFVTENGRIYYYNPDTGALVKGYQPDIGGRKYYFDPDDGHMLTGFQTVGSTRYYFLEEGDVARGFTQIDGVTYGFSADTGAQCFGYTSDFEGKKCFFDPDDGHMRTGIQAIDSVRYYFLPEGDVYKGGFLEIDGKTYFFYPQNGTMWFEQHEIDGKKYYFDPETGEMMCGVFCSSVNNPNGYTYFFDPNAETGVRHGLQDYNGYTYLFHDRLFYAMNRFQSIGSDLYFFEPASYRMVKNHSWTDEAMGLSFQAGADGRLALENTAQTQRSSILFKAMTSLNIPYGEGDGQLVCSTFVNYAYDAAGYSYMDGMRTYQQSRFAVLNGIRRSSLSELLPGDLIFWNQEDCYNGGAADCIHRFTDFEGRSYHIHHVSIYLGNGQVVEEAEKIGCSLVQNIGQDSEDFNIAFCVNLLDYTGEITTDLSPLFDNEIVYGTEDSDAAPTLPLDAGNPSPLVSDDEESVSVPDAGGASDASGYTAEITEGEPVDEAEAGNEDASDGRIVYDLADDVPPEAEFDLTGDSDPQNGAIPTATEPSAPDPAPPEAEAEPEIVYGTEEVIETAPVEGFPLEIEYE